MCQKYESIIRLIKGTYGVVNLEYVANNIAQQHCHNPSYPIFSLFNHLLWWVVEGKGILREGVVVDILVVRRGDESMGFSNLHGLQMCFFDMNPSLTWGLNNSLFAKALLRLRRLMHPSLLRLRRLLHPSLLGRSGSGGSRGVGNLET